jgi:hypothetical protein
VEWRAGQRASSVGTDGVGTVDDVWAGRRTAQRTVGDVRGQGGGQHARGVQRRAWAATQGQARAAAQAAEYAVARGGACAAVFCSGEREREERNNGEEGTRRFLKTLFSAARVGPPKIAPYFWRLCERLPKT